jgi:hypothetical protein
MTITHLVDTDWVVHYLNGRRDIVARLDVLKHQGLGLSVRNQVIQTRGRLYH